ncbi:uncharacterized protein LOC111043885 isoform X2 [Nilaparvata lugens]|uniref:uncharacterized protein LOC111043885 isoform X2 n=1 Tax=Nilaparvata lugens TaxID=108931 RepID=UPI00193E9DC2|nr:uncharacterized protein LOC111043885 isoform X2 [Nilaparvata lugens]
MCAVVRDAQGFGSTLKLTQQQKGANYAYAIPDHRLGSRSPGASQPATTGSSASSPQQQHHQPDSEQQVANLTSIWPPQLQYTFRAIQLIQQTAAGVQEVSDIVGEETLPVMVADVAASAQSAFIFSELSLGNGEEPLKEAVNATREAATAARKAADAAIRLSTTHASANPGSPQAARAVRLAQRATLTAQSAQQIVAAANPFIKFNAVNYQLPQLASLPTLPPVVQLMMTD